MRVLLADDAVLIRDGVGRLLEDAGFCVVGMTDEASRLVDLASELEPDVVITDVRMAPTFTVEGLRGAIELRRRFPEIGVLVLSQYIETRYAVDLLGGGARGVGYLLKERVGALEDFLGAIRRVAAGGIAIDPEMVTLLMGRSQRAGSLDRLSRRESEILSLMAEGLSNAAMARQLSVGLRTVESHVGSIFTKLGLLPDLHDERRVLAVIQYLRG
ncbi:MAG: response regulator [Acidimicrobiales bacterium]